MKEIQAERTLDFFFFFLSGVAWSGVSVTGSPEGINVETAAVSDMGKSIPHRGSVLNVALGEDVSGGGSEGGGCSAGRDGQDNSSQLK